MPTHIASLGRLDGFNLPSNNVNTMSLARTYRGIPRDWGAIPPSPVSPEMKQYKPPAFGRRFVLPFQGLRVLGGIAPQSLGIPRYVLARLMVFYQYNETFKKLLQYPILGTLT